MARHAKESLRLAADAATSELPLTLLISGAHKGLLQPLPFLKSMRDREEPLA